VFFGFGVLARTCFWPTFGPYFCPCFPALGNPTMLPTVQKFLGRVFAHREQECPSAKGSVSREVNKSRKAGIHEPRMFSLEPVSAHPEPVFRSTTPVRSTWKPATPAHHRPIPRSSPLHLQVSHRRHPTWRNHGPLIVLGTSREWSRLKST
jgi:hypothetical protein